MSVRLKGFTTPHNNYMDAVTAGRYIATQLKERKGVATDDLVIDDKALFELDWNVREVENARESLKNDARRIKDLMDRMIDRIDGECFSPNSNGELQGTGVALDVATAVYCEKVSQLEKWLIKNYKDFIDLSR